MCFTYIVGPLLTTAVGRDLLYRCQFAVVPSTFLGLAEKIGGPENFIAETQSTWDWLYLWINFCSILHVPNCFPSLWKCQKFGPPQNGQSMASSMAYSFGQKLCFFTFVVPIDRRKKVLTADQIIIFYTIPSFHTNRWKHATFSGRRGLRRPFWFWLDIRKNKKRLKV